MPRHHWNILSAVLLIGGCNAANHSDPRAEGSGKVNAADVKFETSEDPPLQAKTHFAAGQLAETRGDYLVAVEQYGKAIKLQPKCKEALYHLGIVYCHLERYSDGIIAWNEYLKATDGEATGYSNLGFCYELANKHSQAEAAYRQGLEKDPNNNPCRVNFGLMLARDNRIGEATIQLQAVLSPAEVHYNLASVYEQQGHPDRAKAEYRKALDADPSLSDAEVRLSVLK